VKSIGISPTLRQESPLPQRTSLNGRQYSHLGEHHIYVRTNTPMRTIATHCGLLAFSISTVVALGTTTSFAQIILNQMGNGSSYEAPLHNCDADNVLPDQYIVYFVENYTMEQHKSTSKPLARRCKT